ncbi:MAG: DUF1073 domain-containing protein [Sutterella sp.]|nr:DUF1073 domain-containing protein [Sutterella sp.]
MTRSKNRAKANENMARDARLNLRSLAETESFLYSKGSIPSRPTSQEDVRKLLSLPVSLASTEEDREEQNVAFDSLGGFSTYYSSLQAHTSAFGQVPMMGFMGYGFLQQIAQNGMIRNCIKATSDDITREWIELEGSGDDEDKERIEKLNQLMESKYPLKQIMNQAAIMAGMMGGCLIFIDTGEQDVEFPLVLSKDSGEFGKPGRKLRFLVVDPVNVSPSRYNSTDPLRPDFMQPTEWYVLGRRVHASRMLRIVFNEPPTLMKPAYNFLGIPQAQILWDYVAHWNACREACLEVAQKMNLLLLKTNARELMATPGGIQNLDIAVRAIQTFRSNNSVAVADIEDQIENVQMTISGLTDITRQAAEDICAINGTPATKTLAISPAGFNATGESDLRNYYDRIRSQQELLRDPILKMLHAIELEEFGEIDDSISFSFKELAKQDEALVAQSFASRVGALTMLKDRNAISADELREAVKNEESSSLSFLTGEAPEDTDQMESDNPFAALLGGGGAGTPQDSAPKEKEPMNGQPTL